MVRTKNNNFSNRTRIGILILLILITPAYFALSGQDMPFSISGNGLTVTSVSTDPNIISESTDLSSANWIIYTALNGGGESLEGTVTPAITAANSNYESEVPLTIKVSAVDEVFEYPIVNSGGHAYKYRTEIRNPGECGNAAYVMEWYGFVFIHTKDICVYQENAGTLGDLNTPQNKLTAKIDLAADGKTIPQTIDTKGQQNVDFRDSYGNWYGSASWTGNLVTGDAPDSAALYVATYSPDDNYWRISYRSELTNYQSEETALKALLTKWALEKDSSIASSVEGTKQVIDSTIAPTNAAADKLTGGTDATIGKAQTIVNRDNLNTGKVQVIYDDRTVGYPTVRFLIRANWIGINIPTGKPEILSVNCPEFASGDSNGVCYVEVENIGDGEGTFYATFTDPSGVFSQLYSSQKYSMDPGESGTIPVYIGHGTTAAETTKSCLVSVIDYHDSCLRDDAYVSVSMTAPKTCVPDSLRAEGVCVYPCNSAGTGELEPLCCGPGFSLQYDSEKTAEEYGGWHCEEKIVDTIPGSTEDPGILLKNALYIVIGIVLAALILYMAYDIVKEIIVRKFVGK